MRGAANGAALATEEDVAVAAHAGVARPLVARDAHEAARRVEGGGQAVELSPERIGDLKIVALVADDVEEGEIARVTEIAFRRAHADGFAALPVQVAPIAPQRRGLNHAQRIGTGEFLAVGHEAQLEIAFRLRDEIIEHAWTIAAFDRNGLRQSADRARGHERQRSGGLARGIAPGILGKDREAQRLADHSERGPYRLPLRGRARHQREGGLLWQLSEFIGGERIDRRFELYARFAIGLQAISGRAVTAVAHAHGKRITGPKIAAADADQERVGVRTDVEPVEPHVELGAVARFHRGEIGGGGVRELRLAHVGGRAPGDFHHAGVVDAEGARRIGQSQLGIRARDKGSARCELDRAHVLGKIGGERHNGTSTRRRC